ncbi:hypothetical protein HDC94_001484 [Leifsonia sp. AK011]|uniref:hypothetical protein n=1 Tax=Leifsonia sp. AK011 TaxID=2723075 RepID=UPI0015C85A7E|nr:hypothetical protein [Leifsonia sp. AK011]NYF10328.1 hypothetical protein [Leifsonia sp. AK011]
MAERKPDSTVGTTIKLIVSIAAIVVGLFLVFGAASAPVADAVFVGSIAAVLAVYLWSGVTPGQARLISVVLIFVAVYAFVRGFSLLELTVFRQIGGITAIVSGVILLLPFLRARFGKAPSVG